MGYWNHRVIYKKDKHTEFESFEIQSWTEESVSPFGETKKL